MNRVARVDGLVDCCCELERLGNGTKCIASLHHQPTLPTGILGWHEVPREIERIRKQARHFQHAIMSCTHRVAVDIIAIDVAALEAQCHFAAGRHRIDQAERKLMCKTCGTIVTIVGMRANTGGVARKLLLVAAEARRGVLRPSQTDPDHTPLKHPREVMRDEANLNAS